MDLVVKHIHAFVVVKSILGVEKNQFIDYNKKSSRYFNCI